MLLPYQKRVQNPQNNFIPSVVGVRHILAIPSLDLQKKANECISLQIFE